jgi:hypothetical protein
MLCSATAPVLGAVGSILGWALNQLGPDMQKLGCPQLAKFDNCKIPNTSFLQKYANTADSSLQPISGRKVVHGGEEFAIVDAVFRNRI